MCKFNTIRWNTQAERWHRGPSHAKIDGDQRFAMPGPSRDSKQNPINYICANFFLMSSTTMIIIAASIIGGFLVIYLIFYFADKRSIRAAQTPQPDKTVLPLQLQAYERLVLLAERISLPNLVSRINQPELTAKQMQQLLTLSIKQEFEHNITQQIYVSREAWDAVNNLKEQNLLVINQVASYLPENAMAADLNRSLMELLIQNPNASLHNIVSEALQFEAKKLMSA